MRKIGQQILVKSGLDFFQGKLIAVEGQYVVTLVDWAWVASTGRFHVFMSGQTDSNTEIEPAPAGLEKTVVWNSVDDWPYPPLREVV